MEDIHLVLAAIKASHDEKVVRNALRYLKFEHASESEQNFLLTEIVRDCDEETFRILMPVLNEEDVAIPLARIYGLRLDESRFDTIQGWYPEVSSDDLVPWVYDSVAFTRVVERHGSPSEDVVKKLLVSDRLLTIEDREVVEECLAEMTPFASKPEWIIIGEQLTDLVDEVPENLSCVEVANTVFDLAQDQINYEELYRIICALPLKGRAALLGEKPMIDDQLNAWYGPISGDCRMLTCCDHQVVDEHSYNPDHVVENWFVGFFCICFKRIEKKCWALRRPIPSGGWADCFCSFECLEEIEDYDRDYGKMVFENMMIIDRPSTGSV